MMRPVCLAVIAILIFGSLNAGASDDDYLAEGIQAFEAKNYSAALDRFTPLAEEGNPVAQYYLGKMHYFGLRVPIDSDLAYSFLSASAEIHYPPSYHDLAVCYFWGTGTERDIQLAMKWMRKSVADAADPRAMEFLASTQIEQRQRFEQEIPDLGSIESGLALRKRAAELGNIAAQRNLFVEYYNGLNVPQDKEKALEWLTTAADNGSPEAQWDLGRNYLNGWDVEQDQVKAFALYERAANAGYSQAAIALGSAYAMGVDTKGVYVQQDSDAALYWLNKSNGVGGELAYAFAYLHGGGSVPRDRALAEQWLRKDGSQKALSLIPMMYWHEPFGTLDQKKSIELALQVEPLLQGEAQTQMQLFLMGMYLMVDDYTGTVLWANALSEKGHPDASAWLGFSMLEGRYIEKNFNEGWRLIAVAASNGNLRAQVFLGAAYAVGSEALAFGSGVELDAEKARYWLSQAVAQGDEEAEQFLLELDAELERQKQELARQEDVRRLAREKELARREQIRRLEQLAQLDAVRREKLALERELAEIKRQQRMQAVNASKQPTLGERLVGSFFEALGDGLGQAVTAKVRKELGIKTADERRLEEFRDVVEEENQKLRRQMRLDARMQQIMRNLQNTSKIGCESYGC